MSEKLECKRCDRLFTSEEAPIGKCPDCNGPLNYLSKTAPKKAASKEAKTSSNSKASEPQVVTESSSWDATKERVSKTSAQEVSFLKALFDFKFEQFIYIRVARVIYAALVILVAAAAAFVFLVSLFSLGDPRLGGSSLVLLLITPVAALLTIITLRLTFESGIALVAIAENTKKK